MLNNLKYTLFSMDHFSRHLALGAVLLLLSGLSFSVKAESSDIVIIANVHSSSLSKQQVADIFLGRSSAQSQWRPIDSKDEILRENFYQLVAGVSANRARAQWARLVFSARLTPPRELSSEAASAAINDDEWSVAYLYRRQVPKNAQILLELR